MNKAEYPYPTDEFDTVEPDSGPRGVHRVPRSRWSRAWPFVLVILVFPALAYGAVTYWTGSGGGSEAASPATEAATSAESPAQTPAETPVETPAATPSEPAATPAPAPDLDTPVIVYNATSTSGLAAAAVGTLEDAGWTDATPADFTGASLTASTVLYGAPELESSARAAAEALGIATVELAETDAVDGIEIVLESDFEP